VQFAKLEQNAAPKFTIFQADAGFFLYLSDTTCIS